MDKAKQKRILEERQKRGIEAEKILSNPLVVTALQFMEKEIIRDMKRLKHNDLEGRDNLWRDLQAVNRFTERFKQYIVKGKESQTLLQRLIRGEK